jgi:hypothetical protein
MEASMPVLHYVTAFQKAVTASAAALTTKHFANGFVIKAKSTNAGKVWVGGSDITNTDDGTGTGFALAAGDSLSIALDDSSILYIIGTANDVVYVLGN